MPNVKFQNSTKTYVHCSKLTDVSATNFNKICSIFPQTKHIKICTVKFKAFSVQNLEYLSYLE